MRLFRCPFADHPRSCGANRVTAPTSSSSFGSSPLVRGQRDRVKENKLRHRIIPARAGPTKLTAFIEAVNADHPRSCGANYANRVWHNVVSGSSPLVRGQLWWPVVLVILLRIIPARAGPTSGEVWISSIKPDHPRSCGANSSLVIRPRNRRGSSPLVRGQLAPVETGSAPARIIPARAGPTFGISAQKQWLADHPRSCGANPDQSADAD